MAQAGLHIPAAPGSRLPVFRSVFADIGDEQSIAANLSTFSWHVTNIASMDRMLALPALVLFDELGSGTDPAEGGALATAVVDHFKSRGALVVCTSHSEAVKTYATTTAGVTVAAFGFDPASFAPSYRLVYGSPGPEPRARDRRPPRAGPGGPRQGPPEHECARRAAGGAPGPHRPGPERSRARSAAGGARAAGARRIGIAAPAARRGAAPARGGVPPEDGGAARRAPARRPARGRQGDRRPQEEGVGDDDGGRAPAVEAVVHGAGHFDRRSRRGPTRGAQGARPGRDAVPRRRGARARTDDDGRAAGDRRPGGRRGPRPRGDPGDAARRRGGSRHARQAPPRARGRFAAGGEGRRAALRNPTRG